MVVGRLAPSPTGSLHLGHARSFLLAWWSAKSQGGIVRLRLEDLDHQRTDAGYIEQCKRDLEWLGLTWDGTPRLQSAGVHRIVAAANALEGKGLAYRCVCTRGDLRAAISAPQTGSLELRYSGKCRDRAFAPATSTGSGRSQAALRFRVPNGEVTVDDGMCGTQSFDVAAEVGDFLILRRDQIPSYQLAVVVDDAEDDVTEVVRGDDLLPSAARQILLERALGLSSKRYFHAPLVTDQDGRRLAKRTDALGLVRLRQAGVDPRAIVGWVARESGMPQVDRASAAELISEFNWKHLPNFPVAAGPNVIDSLLESR